MREWIPLLQTLVWPFFIILFIVWFRSAFANILEAIADRIKSGASIEVGPGGMKIGTVQSPVPAASIVAKDTRRVDELPHKIYLTHQALRDVTLDHNGYNYYRLKIALDADENEMLDDVEKVVYHLHPTFKDPDRNATDRRTNFEIRTAAWGEFNMTAEVFFRSKLPKLVIERYINFPARL